MNTTSASSQVQITELRADVLAGNEKLVATQTALLPNIDEIKHNTQELAVSMVPKVQRIDDNTSILINKFDKGALGIMQYLALIVQQQETHALSTERQVCLSQSLVVLISGVSGSFALKIYLHAN